MLPGPPGGGGGGVTSCPEERLPGLGPGGGNLQMLLGDEEWLR